MSEEPDRPFPRRAALLFAAGLVILVIALFTSNLTIRTLVFWSRSTSGRRACTPDYRFRPEVLQRVREYELCPGPSSLEFRLASERRGLPPA